MAVYKTTGAPGRRKSTTNNPYRRAMIEACDYANNVHDIFDAEYAALVLSHPAMKVFGDSLMRAEDPGIKFCIRITMRNYRDSAKEAAANAAKAAARKAARAARA